MSPSYWTASQIKMAAREHGWEIRAAKSPDAGWTIHKERCKVTIGERRDGGLCWIYLRYPKYGGMNCDYFGPRYRGKLAVVLKFLATR
jgi:hypothetical protein